MSLVILEAAKRVKMLLEPNRPASKRYSASLAFCALAVVLSWLTYPFLGENTFWFTGIVALMSLIYGGVGPMFMTALIGFVSTDYLFSNQQFSSHYKVRALIVLTQLFLAIVLRKAWEKAELEKRNAEASLKSRDYLVAVAAHELKTPLSAMKLQIELIQRVSKEEAVSKKYHTLSRQVSRLQELVNSLLDVSRINTGRLELHKEDTNLITVITDVVTRSAQMFRTAGCDVKLELSSRIIGVWDRMRLEQVLMNLLANAIKYGPGKPIIVKAWSNDGTAFISVQDFGIGIAKEDQERIFEQFERAAPKTSYGGLGLGLWIVTQIVKAKGGKISVESTFGKGSTFTVCFPLNHELRHPGEETQEVIKEDKE